MLNINFVPDDYIQNNEFRRTNLMYIVLFAVVMAVLGGSFTAIKVRQRAIDIKERLVNEKMTKAKESINQFEQLQADRKVMLKTALTTAELLEPVPRSVLLASLTNNLPAGMSLLKLNLVQKEPKKTFRTEPASRYAAEQAQKSPEAAVQESPEKSLETCISIEGVAPSDLEVSAYMNRLNNSLMVDNVALVESKEYKIEDATFRQFKLTAMLKKNIHLSKEDIGKIKVRNENVVF